MTRRNASELLHEEKRTSSMLSSGDGKRPSLGEEAGHDAGERLMRGEHAALAEEGDVGYEGMTGPAGNLTQSGKVKLVHGAAASALAAAQAAVDEERGEQTAPPQVAAVQKLRQARARAAKLKSGEAAGNGASGTASAASASTSASSAHAGQAAPSGRAAKAPTSAREAGKAGDGKLARSAAYGQRAAAQGGAATGTAGTAGAATGGAGATGTVGTAGAGGGTAGAGGIAAVGGIALVAVLALTFLCLIFAIAVTLDSSSSASGDGAEKIVAVAKAEFESGERDGTYHSGGDKYWSWAGKTSRIEWCACFVCWCANECGYIESGLFPKSNGCSALYSWFSDPKHGKQHPSASYTPKKGDLAFIGPGDHVAIVGEVEGSTFWTYEGNSPDRVSHWPNTVGASPFTHFVTPAYPAHGSGALMEGVDFSVGKQRFIKEWSTRIDAFFRNYNASSPLIGHGKAFAEAAWEAHFDPRFLPAVSIKESSGGIYVPSYAPYNCYGWGVTDSGPVSEAYSDGYDALIHHIIVEGVLGSKPLREYTSVDEIARAPWPANPEPWASQVKEFMSKI